MIGEYPGGDGADRLSGRHRARLLIQVRQPCSPTALSDKAQLPVGAVGTHLRILLDAGLITRRRTGTHVLYRRTVIGDDLIASAT